MTIFRHFIYYSTLVFITACGQAGSSTGTNEQIIQTTVPSDSFLTYLLIPKGQLFFDKPYKDQYISYEDIYLNNIEDKKSEKEKTKRVKCCTTTVFSEKSKIIGKTITCYNKNGDVTSFEEYQANKLTTLIKHRYNDKNKVIESSFSGDVEVCDATVKRDNTSSYSYDSTGRLVSIKSGNSQTTFSYDSLGNKTAEIHKDGTEQWTTKYFYKGINLVGVEYYQPKDKSPTWNTVLVYDSKGRCIKETYYSFGSRSTQREYEYDSIDNIVVGKYLNADLSVSSIDRHYYSADNNLLKATNEGANGKVIPKDTFITNHQLRTVTKIRNDKHKTEYQYNSVGQLIKETDFGYDGQFGTQTIYTYDNGLLKTEDNYAEDKFKSKKVNTYEFYSP
jgi:YD repeat-containing protein